MRKTAILVGGAASMAGLATSTIRHSEGVAGTARERAKPDLPTGLPDRMSTVPDSPHYSYKYRGVAVYLNGRVMPNNVEEYCVSGGWLRTVDGRRLEGLVEPRWRDSIVKKHVGPTAEQAAAGAASRLEAAEAKRERKKLRRLRQGIVGAAAWWLVVSTSSGTVALTGALGFEPYASREHCMRAGQMAKDSYNGYALLWTCVPDEAEVGE